MQANTPRPKKKRKPKSERGRPPLNSGDAITEALGLLGMEPRGGGSQPPRGNRGQGMPSDSQRARADAVDEATRIIGEAGDGPDDRPEDRSEDRPNDREDRPE